jgi:hypothetical protein
VSAKVSTAGLIARGTGRELIAYAAALGWSNAIVIATGLVVLGALAYKGSIDPQVVMVLVVGVISWATGGAMKSVTNAVSSVQGDRALTPPPNPTQGGAP